MTSPRPTRFFYDTEFLEDGIVIDLISIGIVCEDGREYYAVNEDADWSRIHAHSWLERNVVPHLGIEAHRRPHAGIAADVHHFLTGQVLTEHAGALEEVELWAHYSAYDHVVLAQLFGAMIDLPRGIPMFTNDTRALASWLKAPDSQIPKQLGSNHDALADARHVKVMYDYLMALR